MNARSSGLDLKPIVDGPIVTARTQIRRLSHADAPDLYDVFSDPAVMRYWSSPPYERTDQVTRLIDAVEAGYDDGSFFQFGIVDASESKVVGTCTLHQIDRQNRRAEVGYVLGRRSWGRGLMSEALTALLTVCFRDVGFHRIEADTDPRNAASVRLLERLGFQREGLLRQRWIVAGEVSDTAFYGLLADEWSP
ncbi:MAG: GNAT family N-acetyltransferase [Armatimonadetes bacterium]|nr:GNAT family N-acetyltransferase [Armatimonadota bacterium]